MPEEVLAAADRLRNLAVMDSILTAHRDIGTVTFWLARMIREGRIPAVSPWACR